MSEYIFKVGDRIQTKGPEILQGQILSIVRELKNVSAFQVDVEFEFPESGRSTRITVLTTQIEPVDSRRRYL